MDLTLACMLYIANVHFSLLTLNMQSDRYMWLSGIITYCTSFCGVYFSFSAGCATLIPHHLLKSSVVVFKCFSADKKDFGCLISVEFFGGYGTVSIWMSFTCCSVTMLDTCCCCSLVALSIAMACFPDIRTLSTSLLLKLCVLNMMSSYSAIWCSSFSVGWWILMPILDTFCASISSFT